MIKVMFISFWVNLLLTIGKVVVGYFGFNHALMADGIASLSDMITDILAIIGGLFSKKHPNKKHPFGYGKVEYIASLCVGIVVLILGVVVLLNLSLDSYSTPLIYTLLFTVLFIIVKMLLVRYLYKMGKRLNSQIILDSMLESKTDIYGTFVVLISTTLMYLTEYFEFLKYADFVASILISILIFRVGFIIIKHNVSELLDRNHSGSVYKIAKEIILNHKEIDSIKKMYLLKYGAYYQFIGEIIFKDDIHISEAHDIIEKITEEFKSKKIKYTFIEIDSK